VLTPRNEFVLPGISRETVIELCGELGIPCREADLDLYDAGIADEIFMTSTSLCICPVRSIGGRALSAPLPGPVTKRISDAYANFVECDFVAQYLKHLA
jgi:branched-chain amino acid aminotransferase